MKKTRVTFIVIIAAIAGFFTYRFVMRVLEVIKLSKTLPEYLRDMIGVRPSVCCNMMLPYKLELKIGLKRDIIEREKDLVDVVENYIKDFYPNLATIKMEIKVYELPEKDDDGDD